MILDKFVVIVHKFVRFRTRKSKNAPSAPKSAPGVWKETSTFVS